MKTKLPEFDPKGINAGNVYDYVHHDEDTPRNSGVDSFAYHFGRWELRWFHREITLERVQLLMQMTNEAAKHAPDYTAEIECWGTTSLRVVKMIKVFEADAPKDRDRRRFGIERYVGGYHPKRHQFKGLDELLNRFAYDMMQKLGVDGIEIPQDNTKIERSRGFWQSGESVCTITDLCQYLEELRLR